MRKILAAVIIVGLMGFLAVCKGPSSKVPSVEKTSFETVTSRLDEGGSLYLYVSTEKIAKAVDDLLEKLRTVVESQPGDPPAEKEQILGMFDLVNGLVEKIGMSEISGIGVSSVAMTEALNHSKFVVHHYRGEDNGLLWRMWDKQPHAMPGLKLLPADTVLAQFSDCRLNELWRFIKAVAGSSGIPKIQQGLESFEQMLAKQGISLDALLDSVSGMGFLLTLDTEKKWTIPVGPAPMEIPEPGLAIMLEVKDGTLFDILQSKLTFAERSDDEKIRRLRVPPLPLPVPLQPEIVQSDNLILLASHGSVTEAVFAARDQGNGLITTPEFRNLAVNIPQKGNSFWFRGARLYQEFKEFQRRGIEAAGELQPGGAITSEMLDILPKGMISYGVLQSTDEGLVYTFNHTMDLESAAVLSAAGAVGVAAAAIVPYLSGAKKK